MKIEKLMTLPDSTKLKKIALILEGVEKNIICLTDSQIDEYLKIAFDCESVDKKLFENLVLRYKTGERLSLISHYLNIITSRCEADWDWVKSQGTLDNKKRVVDEIYLVLDEIRSPYNLGSIFRSAESFRVKKIFVLGNGASPLHQKAIRSSCGCVDALEWQALGRKEFLSLIKSDNILSALPILSLECGGEDVNKYNFPQKGILIVGNEEFGISKELIDISQAVLSIPLYGAKGSINVSIATAICLQAWSAHGNL